MMKKRFVPSQSFGSRSGSNSNSMVSQATNWVYENKVMALVVVISIVALALGITAYVKEDFRNQLMELFSGSKKEQLKELDVLFFMSPTCPWCQKMMKVLDDEGKTSEITVIDVSKPDGQEVAKKFGAASRGVPNFVSRKLNTGTVGYKDSTAKVIEALLAVKKPGSTAEPHPPGGHSHPENEKGSGRPQEQKKSGDVQVDPQDVASLGIVVFVTEGCPWCTKAKDDAQNLGIMPYLELQDLNTPEGKAALQQSGVEFKGAPTFFSRATGKTAVGYRPFNQIITALVSE